MSKLVDKERLAKLAAALDARAKAAVAAEQERAMGVEEGLQAAIDLINNVENGILAQAKAHVAEEIVKVNEANGNVVGDVENLQQANQEMQEEINANKALLEKLDGGAEVEGSVKKQIADAVKVEADKVAALDERMGVVEGKNGEQDQAIEAAQEDATQALADAAAVAGRATALEQADVRMQGEIDANEAAIAKLNGAVGEEGSVAKAVEDAVAPVRDLAGENEAAIQAMDAAYKAADARDLQAAKDYADAQITALVNGAPEAMNTLKELADSIANHQDAYDAYVETMSAELAKKVDKIEGSRLVAETEIAAFNAKAEVADVEAAEAAAKKFAQEEDAKLQALIEAIQTKDGEQDVAINAAQQQANKGVEDAAAVAARATALEAADVAMQAEIDANEAAIAANKAIIDKLDGALDVEGSVKAQIKAAVDPVQGEVDAVEERVQALEDADEAMQGEVDALEGRMDAVEGKNATQDTAIQAAQQQADKGVQDAAAVAERAEALEGRATALEKADVKMQGEIDANEAAIAKLNGGADVDGSVANAIAGALEDFSTTEEMKAIIGNVVQSLSLSIADNKIKLALGGVDGIVLAEQSLDMATDADIDEIINGLDA